MLPVQETQLKRRACNAVAHARGKLHGRLYVFKRRLKIQLRDKAPRPLHVGALVAQLHIALNAVNLPGLENAGLNGRVLVFTAAAAVFTGLLFGLLPARQLLGGDLNRTLRESGRGAVSPRGGRGSRGGRGVRGGRG